ncbi:hypothetical protein [Candidatus Vidania fulgoroideorum]
MKKKRRPIVILISQGDSSDIYSIRSKDKSKTIRKYNKRIRRHILYISKIK